MAKLVDLFRAALETDANPFIRLLELAETSFPTFAEALKQPERTNLTKFAPDFALKNVLQDLIYAATNDKVQVMQYRLPGQNEPAVPQLLDLTLAIYDTRDGKDGTKSPNASIFSMLEDLVEGSTVEEADAIFAYFESKQKLWEEDWSSAWEGQGAAKLALLRFCNQLMKRLLRSRHSELSGRILIFCARLFPLSDKSGLNHQGHINTSHPIVVEDVKEDAQDCWGQDVDIEFYNTLWGLQKVFQDPFSAADPATWTQVAASIRRVLSELKRQPATVPAGPLRSLQPDGDAATVEFLSSPKLLRLQLRDATLRRIWLIQCLILFVSLRNPPKGKPALMSKPEAEVKELESLVYRELARTPDHGQQVEQAMKGVMQREEGYIKWKLDGCQKFERPPVKLLPPPPAKKYNRPVMSDGTLDLGHPDLTRLWNVGGNKGGVLKSIASTAPPPPSEQLRTFLQPVIDEMDPDFAPEEQYKTKKDPMYFWKACRLISREDSLKFTEMLQIGKAEPDLDIAARSLFPDLFPQPNPVPGTTSSMGGGVTESTPEPSSLPAKGPTPEPEGTAASLADAGNPPAEMDTDPTLTSNGAPGAAPQSASDPAPGAEGPNPSGPVETGDEGGPVCSPADASNGGSALAAEPSGSPGNVKHLAADQPAAAGGSSSLIAAPSSDAVPQAVTGAIPKPPAVEASEHGLPAGAARVNAGGATPKEEPEGSADGAARSSRGLDAGWTEGDPKTEPRASKGHAETNRADQRRPGAGAGTGGGDAGGDKGGDEGGDGALPLPPRKRFKADPASANGEAGQKPLSRAGSSLRNSPNSRDEGRLKPGSAGAASKHAGADNGSKRGSGDGSRGLFSKVSRPEDEREAGTSRLTSGAEASRRDAARDAGHRNRRSPQDGAGDRHRRSPQEDTGDRRKKSPQDDGDRRKRSPQDEDPGDRRRPTSLDGSGDCGKRSPQDESGDPRKRSPQDESGDRRKRSPQDETGDRRKRSPQDESGDRRKRSPQDNAGDQRKRSPQDDAGDRRKRSPQEDAGDQPRKRASPEAAKGLGKDADAGPQKRPSVRESKRAAVGAHGGGKAAGDPGQVVENGDSKPGRRERSQRGQGPADAAPNPSNADARGRSSRHVGRSRSGNGADGGGLETRRSHRNGPA